MPHLVRTSRGFPLQFVDDAICQFKSIMIVAWNCDEKRLAVISGDFSVHVILIVMYRVGSFDSMHESSSTNMACL